MQRMKLHLSGVKLPRLGSVEDRIYRQYLVKDAELEAKKMEMVMLTTLTNPRISDQSKSREWTKAIKDVWSDYLSLLLNIEIPEATQKEMDMMEYYQGTVKKAKLSVTRDRKGGLKLSGVEQLLPN